MISSLRVACVMKLLAFQLLVFGIVLSVMEFHPSSTRPMGFLKSSISDGFPAPSRVVNGSLVNPQNRGIVICVHEGNFAAALSLITELICLGNQFPIELHHCTKTELPTDLEIALKHSVFANTKVVDSCAMAAEQNIPRPSLFAKSSQSWLKPLALLMSSFDQVMVIDPYTMFVRSPQTLWECDGFMSTGALFFHERNLVPAEKADGRYTHLLRKYTDLYLRDPSIKATDIKLSNSFVSLLRTSFDSLSTIDPSFFIVHKTKFGDRLPRLLKQLLLNLPRDQSFKWLTPHDAIHFLFELMHEPTYVSPLGANTLNFPSDLELHPNVFCGPIAQRWPELDLHQNDTLFFVQSSTLLNPSPLALQDKVYTYQGYNDVSSSITPLQLPQAFQQNLQYPTCQSNIAQWEDLQASFYSSLARRRAHYHAVVLGTSFGLLTCT
ncbi:hypothetical protein THRCLA_20440 [Thraustotheca clavata]|uniref:Uncharacterized protein n=1 Tax=Thraustotheca clavata TaxID=74557 RepID=A0A1W0A7E1_9STRA|nr:hypothetical protein THRCLA_20440 [Thraustotheca clavata]